MINNNGYLIKNLKCIGGPNDGKQVSIGDADRVGDFVKVEKKKKYIPLTKFPLSYEEIRDEMVMHYNTYIIDCFHFSSEDKFYFLRPASWTNKQAILHQFNK